MNTKTIDYEKLADDTTRVLAELRVALENMTSQLKDGKVPAISDADGIRDRVRELRSLYEQIVAVLADEPGIHSSSPGSLMGMVSRVREAGEKKRKESDAAFDKLSCIDKVVSDDEHYEKLTAPLKSRAKRALAQAPTSKAFQLTKDISLLADQCSAILSRIDGNITPGADEEFRRLNLNTEILLGLMLKKYYRTDLSGADQHEAGDAAEAADSTALQGETVSEAEWGVDSTEASVSIQPEEDVSETGNEALLYDASAEKNEDATEKMISPDGRFTDRAPASKEFRKRLDRTVLQHGLAPVEILRVLSHVGAASEQQIKALMDVLDAHISAPVEGPLDALIRMGLIARYRVTDTLDMYVPSGFTKYSMERQDVRKKYATFFSNNIGPFPLMTENAIPAGKLARLWLRNGILLEYTDWVKEHGTDNDRLVLLNAFSRGDEFDTVSGYSLIPEETVVLDSFTHPSALQGDARVVYVSVPGMPDDDAVWDFIRTEEGEPEFADGSYRLLNSVLYKRTADDWTEYSSDTDGKSYELTETSGRTEAAADSVDTVALSTDEAAEHDSDEADSEVSASAWSDIGPSHNVTAPGAELYRDSDAAQEKTGAVSGTHTAVADENEPDADYPDKVAAMLADAQYHSAMAYLYTLQHDSPLHEGAWQRLAYALDDPMASCEYTSRRVLEHVAEDSPSPIGEACTVAAALRNFFLNECSYDHDLELLFDYAANTSCIRDLPAVRQLMHELKEFKSKYHKGVEAYSGYRFEEQQSNEQRLRDLINKASNQFDVNRGSASKGNIRNARYLKTRKRLLADSGDLGRYLQAVNNADKDAINNISEFISKNYTKPGREVSPQNIDDEKINEIIDAAWEEAGSEVLMKKEGAEIPANLRQALVRKIRSTVVILAEYVQLIGANAADTMDPGLRAYRAKRSKLTELFENAERQIREHTGAETEQRAAYAILGKTVRDLLDIISGTTEDRENRFFYVPFLLSSDITLDDEYLPILEDIPDVPDMLARERIWRHYKSPRTTLEERLYKICSAENIEDEDFGSAELIAEYLNVHPEQIKNNSAFSAINEAGFGYAKPEDMLDSIRKNWQGDLEYAESRGQLDSADGDAKDSMLETVDYWCAHTETSQNFGFLNSVIDSLRRKVESDSMIVAQELLDDLAVWKERNPDWADKKGQKDAADKIIERIDAMDYTAAEDLLNRLRSNDLDIDQYAEDENYLNQFLKEYDVCAKRAGLANHAIQTNPGWLRQSNKDTKMAKRLFENWPKQKGTPETQIQALLEVLGFRSPKVERETETDAAHDSYLVTLDFSNRRGASGTYKHPVSAFGSRAEQKGFRVLTIHGKMDALRLVDTYDELGDTQSTLILLDYSLTLPERRKLARRIKAKSGEASFMVLDRTALMFLAAHYSETAINRMLMAILLPFGTSKLYQPSSAYDMPPELFIGRKKELETIKSPTGANIVYGGRQLGKTALLRKAQKDVDRNQQGDRAVWIDIKEKNYNEAALKVSEALSYEGILSESDITDDWGKLARSIRRRLNSDNNRIPFFLLLLDEADAFIESCMDVKYKPLDELKDVQAGMSGRFKFVVAGLHNVVRLGRDAALGDNIGLTHMESLTVTPFKYREARQLLQEPLSYAGFEFPNDEETARLISTIFSTTNYFPGLLQLYASKLTEALEHGYAGYAESEVPPYVVSEELIRNVLADEKVLEQIVEKFWITIQVDSGSDNYYYWLAILAAFHVHSEETLDGFTPADLKKHAEDYGITHIANKELSFIQGLMEEMRELNIFTVLASGRYRFARKRFLQLMGTYSAVDKAMADYDKVMAERTNA